MQHVNQADTIDAVLFNTEVQALFERYKTTAAESGIGADDELGDLVAKVNEGDRRGFSLLASVISVLEACIWNHKTSWDQKMELAGNSRMLTPAEVAVLVQGRYDD